MIPQYQTLDDNCVQACVASIFDVPIDRVPHFFKWQIGPIGHYRLRKWARSQGYRAVRLKGLIGLLRARRVERSGEFYIGLFLVSPSTEHAVVMRDGNIVFDPGRWEEIRGYPRERIVFKKKRDKRAWLVAVLILYVIAKAC